MIISIMIIIGSIITPHWQQQFNNHYPGGGIARAHLWKEQGGTGGGGEVFRSLSSIQWGIQLLVLRSCTELLIIGIVDGMPPSYVWTLKLLTQRRLTIIGTLEPMLITFVSIFTLTLFLKAKIDMKMLRRRYWSLSILYFLLVLKSNKSFKNVGPDWKRSHTPIFCKHLPPTIEIAELRPIKWQYQLKCQFYG